MSWVTSKGKVSYLRVHREIGFGPPDNHVRVHAIVQLDSEPDRHMGFPLSEDGDLEVHRAWLDMLRDALAYDHDVTLETDVVTEVGTNGVIRMVALTRDS